MIHARKDYQKRWGSDPALENPELLGEGSAAIAEDEPVMLFRAKDKHFLAILQEYAALLQRDGNAVQMREAVEKHARLTSEWQRNHGTKTPDMPKEGDLRMASEWAVTTIKDFVPTLQTWVWDSEIVRFADELDKARAEGYAAGQKAMQTRAKAWFHAGLSVLFRREHIERALCALPIQAESEEKK